MAGQRVATRNGWSAFDLAEGFHVAHALLALERAGILACLRIPVEARRLAAEHGVDRGLLEETLALLAARTTLVACRNGRYRLTRRYDAYARFLIHQYLGAYGPNAAVLERTLRDPSRAARLIDRDEHARAFEEVAALSSSILADLIVLLGVNHVLDLGCGTGMMLSELSARVQHFVEWGLDINPSMCRAARQRLAAAPRRTAIFRGDSRDIRACVPAAVVARVETVAAASVANEFFADGTGAAVAWLAGLKKTFPGRTLLIADYYGGAGSAPKARRRELVLHDFVQIISGQGAPPPNLAAWKKIYRAAGCRLVHVVEDRAAACFAHVLRM
jgi:SAM-dependent methyltransferase